jgi:hypothetical protein
MPAAFSCAETSSELRTANSITWNLALDAACGEMTKVTFARLSAGAESSILGWFDVAKLVNNSFFRSSSNRDCSQLD